MRLLTLLLILMFALVAAYFCYSVYFYGGRWIANPYNPRISSQKQHVVMGTLTDRDGTVLAYTDETARGVTIQTPRRARLSAKSSATAAARYPPARIRSTRNTCSASVRASSSGLPMPLPVRHSVEMMWN